MNKVYRSKRDTWLVVVLWAGSLMSMFGSVAYFGGDAPLPQRLAVLGLSVFLVGFVLSLLYGISYVIDEDELLVGAGPFRQRIPLASIDSVRPSRNPLSSPAASLDRLSIRWNDDRKRVLISPADKTEFMNTLDSRCAHLARVGDELVRVSSGH